MGNQKIKIRETLEAWGGWELDGNLVDAISKLQKIITDNPEHFDFLIDVETESGYYSSCSTNIKITGDRWETDEEFEDRKEADRKTEEAKRLRIIRDAQNKEKEEKLLYESLKRKFEKEIKESN